MMKKKLFVFEDICSGCQSCTVWCSLMQKNKDEFNPQYAKIRIQKNSELNLNRIVNNCNLNCPKNEKGEPICVEMCANGALLYTDYEDYVQKKQELLDKRSQMPLFRLIAPWKYPFPWRPWEEEL